MPSPRVLPRVLLRSALVSTLVGAAACQGLAPAASSSLASPPTPAGTLRVSVAPTGQPNNLSARLSRPAVSHTGKVVAFDSVATNLVSGDTNRRDDVFARDVVAGTTERVSVSGSGAQADGDSSAPSVSGDGHTVAFVSSSTNLTTDVVTGSLNVYVRDRGRGRTQLVSAAADGTPGNAASFMPDVTADGRYVVFVSDATNLLPRPVPEGRRNVYLKDLVTGRVQRVSRAVDGSPLTDAASPVISDDARVVAYSAFSSRVVAGDTNDQVDVFLVDLSTMSTSRISVDSRGRQAEGGYSAFPSVSSDGRVVAFQSEATNLVRGDTNGAGDVFVRDVVVGRTTRVSVGAGGVEANDGVGFGLRGGTVFGPSVSADGRYVTFNSLATNLVADDTNTCSYPGGASFPLPGQCPDVFVRDRVAQSTARVSVSTSGAQGDGASTDPAISGDGLSVAFVSAATNLTARDRKTCLFAQFAVPGSCPDVFLATR